MIGGKALRTVLTVAAVLLTGSTAMGQGPTISGSVYGGGALANTGNTTVNLTGGTVSCDVYGGGMGDASHAPTVGTATVNLNNNVENTSRGCVVGGTIYGCNNLNGTPLDSVTVHIYGTQHPDKATILQKNSIDLYTSREFLTERAQLAYWLERAEELGVESDIIDAAQAVYEDGSLSDDDDDIVDQIAILEEAVSEIESAQYDLKAVYGGGNLAAYDPADPGSDPDNPATKEAKVIVYGCDRSCIEYVYGGGNAASAPATHVIINGGTFDYVFGGGNGFGEDNPGANVGYYTFADSPDHSTKANRLANYAYGSGVATTEVYGGQVNHLFGGSNSKGNIRTEAHLILNDRETCDFALGEVYGGGNEAEMEGNINLELGCLPDIAEIYGGARAANIDGDIDMTITSGTFDKVFGGNNDGGCINGSIQVNIEETGCKPVIIGELYGCGNKAAYSVYGYEQDGEGKWQVLTSGESPVDDPEVNVISCTSIGTVYGGGYGTSAVVVGNPTVNINQIKGVFAGRTVGTGDDAVTYPDALGTIGTVFGGGNAAEVQGNTTVNICTESTVTLESTSATVPVVGVNITGNVFGGGNNAEVTGDTNVVIGKRKE